MENKLPHAAQPIKTNFINKTLFQFLLNTVLLYICIGL